MLRTRTIWAAAVAVALGSTSALALDAPTALEGYCPVCLVKGGEFVKGDASIHSVFDGRKYLFPSEKQKQIFDENPAAFVPAMRGGCTVCKIEKGAAVPGNVRFHSTHNGRLFLFPSAKQQGMFEKNPDRYANADLGLDGNCPICLVNMGKVIPGSPEYASIYDGQRYLFRGPEQKRMFDANPAGFTPALGGKCTVCKIEKNKDVPGTAEFNLTHNGRLYLFPSAKQQKMFESNPRKYASADVAMDGYCTVCKIEMGKDVRGSSKFAVDYNGKRYLFPGKKQRDMFIAYPDKYAAGR